MPEAKSKIHSYIQHIREEIERNVDLDQDKKDKLLSALNKFAGEVDRTRTREQLPGRKASSTDENLGEEMRSREGKFLKN